MGVAFGVVLLCGCGAAVRSATASGGERVPLQSVNAEILQPGGCTWREVSKEPGNEIRLFACAQPDGQVPLTLMVESRDLRLAPPERYFEPIRQGFATAMQKQGGALSTFSYERVDVGTPDAYQYEAEATAPGGTLYTFGYVQFYDRVYAVQGSARTKEEPPVILATAKSIRLLTPAAPVDRTAERAGRAFEILVILLALAAVGYRWSQRSRRHGASDTTPEPQERGPGVRF